MPGKFLFVLLFSFLFNILQAQVTISGQVLNASGNAPVSKASVYINNSTIGTATAEDGTYTLTGVNPGVYEIIVSHVGFEVVAYKVEVKSAALRLTFKLEPKVKQMRDILVVTPSQREKWMIVLKENFLGQTIAADKSKILNEEDIFFEKGQKKNIIKAFSEVPLIIENKELGYRVYFELQEFFYDAEQGRTLFYGFSRYEEMGDPDSEPSRKFRRNREKTYRGSTLHFYHSLLSDALAKEGFTTYITRPSDTTQNSKPNTFVNGNTVTVSAKTPQLAFAVSRNDILFKDSNDTTSFYLRWSGTLQVRYKYDPYYKESLKRKFFVAGDMPQGFQSGIVMIEAPAYLDPNGVLLNPLAVQFSGFWSYEKLANMLPINYRPEKN